MFVNEKIKTFDYKIEQNQAQYDLDRQTLRFLLYLQEALVNINFRQTKKFYQKGRPEKAATIKKSENVSLGSELKKQTDISKTNIKD